MPLIKPNIPSLPPPRPKPHFGGEGTSTPIFSKFPQSSSAGFTINSGGSSHLEGSSAAGNTGHTDPIPSLLPPAGSKVRTLSDGLFSQRIKDNFGIKNLSINISENSQTPIWKEGVAYIKSEGTIFPVRTSRFANDGETWEIYSPSDPTKPGHPIKFEATDWKTNNNTGLQGGAPMLVPFDVNDPYLSPYRASDLEEMTVLYRILERSTNDDRIAYNDATHNSGYIVIDERQIYRWRLEHAGPRLIAEMRLAGADRQIGNPIVLNPVDSRFYRQAETETLIAPPPGGAGAAAGGLIPSPATSASSQPGPANPQTPSSPQPRPSTAPKHPHSPDEAQALPPKRSRGDEEANMDEMPPELTNGSGNFWHIKGQATQQSASNLFRDGKIRDVTYGNDGKEMNGKITYRGNEYRFFYSSRKNSIVTLRDMNGNIATLAGISGKHFSEFFYALESIESTPELLYSSMIRQNMPGNFRIPNEFNPPAAGEFWDKVDPYIQFLLTALYRNGEIYGINFDSGTYGKPRLNVAMRYQGRDYSFTVGMNYQVMFAPEKMPPPGFNNRQRLSDVLGILAGQALSRGTGPTQPYSKQL